MPKLLHILTKADDPLANEVIEQQAAEIETEVIDLTTSQPNYDELLEAIFRADSVQVW